MAEEHDVMVETPEAVETEVVETEAEEPVAVAPAEEEVEATEPESGPHIVEWKGQTYDLRGYTRFVYFQREKNNRVFGHFQADGKLDQSVSVPVSDVTEAQEFEKLCGPYFGSLHLG